MRLNPLLPLATAILLPLSLLAHAHGGATGIVLERMDAMTEIADAMKRLAPVMRGTQPHDGDIIAENAAIISGHAGEDMTALFPEGSLQNASEAREAIWSEWPEFERLALRLEKLSEALADADPEATGEMPPELEAPLDPGLLEQLPPRAIFAMMGATCKNCHQSFRLEKQQ